MIRRSVVAVVAICSARVLAIVLFLFWAAFFIEHLQWFRHPEWGLPPARVWLLQLAHLMMLVGLLMLLRWEVPGSAVSVVAALMSFASVAGNRFLQFFAITSLPAALALLGHLLQGHAAPAP